MFNGGGDDPDIGIDVVDINLIRQQLSFSVLSKYRSNLVFHRFTFGFPVFLFNDFLLDFGFRFRVTKVLIPVQRLRFILKINLFSVKVLLTLLTSSLFFVCSVFMFHIKSFRLWNCEQMLIILCGIRVNDAIDTIIRIDESSETGPFF